MTPPDSEDELAILLGRERKAFRCTCWYLAAALASAGTSAGIWHWLRLTIERMRVAGASSQEIRTFSEGSSIYLILLLLLGLASGFSFLVWLSSWLWQIRERRRLPLPTSTGFADGGATGEKRDGGG